VAADPYQVLPVLRVSAILNRFQKGCVAAYAPNILWRAGPCAVNAGRVTNAGLVLHTLLDGHFVLPPVSEIIDVLERKPAVWRDLGKRYLTLIDKIQA